MSSVSRGDFQLRRRDVTREPSTRKFTEIELKNYLIISTFKFNSSGMIKLLYERGVHPISFGHPRRLHNMYGSRSPRELRRWPSFQDKCVRWEHEPLTFAATQFPVSWKRPALIIHMWVKRAEVVVSPTNARYLWRNNGVLHSPSHIAIRARGGGGSMRAI